MAVETISFYEKAKIEKKDTNSPDFWKNEVIKCIEKGRLALKGRQANQEKEEALKQVMKIKEE